MLVRATSRNFWLGRFRFTEVMSNPRMKIFRFRRRANQRHELARLTRQEGRIMIVTNVQWDAVDADVPITNGADAYGEVVWS